MSVRRPGVQRVPCAALHVAGGRNRIECAMRASSVRCLLVAWGMYEASMTRRLAVHVEDPDPVGLSGALLVTVASPAPRRPGLKVALVAVREVDMSRDRQLEVFAWEAAQHDILRDMTLLVARVYPGNRGYGIRRGTNP